MNPTAIPYENTIPRRSASSVGDLQFATHLLAAMQAVDLAGIEDFAPFTKQVHEQVRKMSAFVEDDRALDKEATAVAQWLKTTELFD